MDFIKKTMPEKLVLLMIDDDERLLGCYVHSLKVGPLPIAVVHTAKNGSVALSVLKENPSINLIISDINMPVMNGWKFLAKFREQNLITPVVMVSSEFHDSALQVDAHMLGAQACLPKPSFPPEIIAAISSCFVL